MLANLVKSMLKPLVRILIRNEVSHSEFAELARQVYVETAYQNFALPRRKMSYARVSILTGLSRKEVVRLTKLCQEDQPAEKKVKANRAARVVTGWLSDVDFVDAQKRAKVLPLKSTENGGISFADLVKRYSGDISLGAILDELERLDIVRYSRDENSVALTCQGYIPQQDSPERLETFFSCASTLLHTGVYNLECKAEEPRLQRQLNYRNVSVATAEKFQQYSKEKSAQLLLDCKLWLDKETQKKNFPNTQKFQEIGLGIYYFEDSNDD